MFTRPEHILVQNADHEVERDLSRHNVHGQHHFYIHYLQVVLLSMEYCHALTDVSPKKECQKGTQTRSESNPLAVSLLAKLAQKLGFYSEHITRLCCQSVKEVAVVRFLYEIRPTEVFDFPEVERHSIAAQVSSWLEQTRPLERRKQATFTTEDACLDKEKRMGRPYGKEYQLDRQSTFYHEFSRLVRSRASE